MATTIKQSFAQYKANLEISDRQETAVSNCRANVTKKLEEKLTLHPDRSMVTGSWDRNTLTRYLKEGDVDVMVVLNYGANKDWWASPGTVTDGTIKALDRFKAILDAAYPSTPKRRDRNCISMQLSEFRLDVVPAYKDNGGYYTIPDSVRKVWVKTSPFKFAEHITAVNEAMGETFVPLIKMVKGWNREVGWPVRSFHLECMMYNHYKDYKQSYTYDTTLQVFLEKLPAYLKASSYEPVLGERVDTYLDNGATPTRRQTAIAKAERAARMAKEARELSEAGKEERAIRKWKELFGEFFPAYG